MGKDSPYKRILKCSQEEGEGVSNSDNSKEFFIEKSGGPLGCCGWCRFDVVTVTLRCSCPSWILIPLLTTLALNILHVGDRQTSQVEIF